MISENDFSYNEDGFPVDKNGNFVFGLDKNGNVVHEFEGGKIIVFCPTDKQQVRKAIKEFAKIFSEKFSKNLEIEWIISVKDKGIYTASPGRLPTIWMYIESVNKALNYLGCVHGIDFEYLVYIEFKEVTNNLFIAAKTKLYNNLAIERSVSFVENWFIEKDKLYLQKLELYKESNQDDNNSNKTVNNPYPRVFKDGKSFELFKYLHETLVRKRYPLADYSFIFRHMQKDGYIYSISEKEFRKFLSDNFEIHLDKLKPGGYCETETKISSYFIARNQFQSK